MQPVAKPSKEQVRQVMEQHRKERTVPTPEEYRRQLGWQLLPQNKSADCAR